MIFLGLFCQKTNYGKKSNFWPKPWTNPFAKSRIFYTFLKRNFSVKESLLFYLEYQQTIFPGLFCPKTNYGKNSNFWPKPWTNPFEKIGIFPLFWKEIFMLKRPSFLSRVWADNISWPFLPKHKLWKKF